MIWVESINGDAADCKSAVFGHDWFDPSATHQRSLVKWMITAGYGPAGGSSILSGPAISKHIAKTAESFCIAGVFYEEVSQRQYVSIWGISLIGKTRALQA